MECFLNLLGFISGIRLGWGPERKLKAKDGSRLDKIIRLRRQSGSVMVVAVSPAMLHQWCRTTASLSAASTFGISKLEMAENPCNPASILQLIALKTSERTRKQTGTDKSSSE